MKLGKLNPDVLGSKDAFHVPGMVVQSDTMLKPGQRVKLVGRNLVSRDEKEGHGIVDIFLEGYIPAGTPFWMMIDPSLVQKLVHGFEFEAEKQYPPLNLPDVQPTCTNCGAKISRIVCASCTENSQDNYNDDDDGCGSCY